ncbi:hypothetical protein FQA47_024179 [Oryzias melastigma]|uniref:Uncharacterized protein n=1 Tax=Oryzias melastigma TaxID=30732 RepID=A0A834L1W8_ORYME|nr:hypothetical protein FQA47_024179 [Oryzias melastigma]
MVGCRCRCGRFRLRSPQPRQPQPLPVRDAGAGRRLETAAPPPSTDGPDGCLLAATAHRSPWQNLSPVPVRGACR